MDKVRCDARHCEMFAASLAEYEAATSVNSILYAFFELTFRHRQPVAFFGDPHIQRGQQENAED